MTRVTDFSELGERNINICVWKAASEGEDYN